MIITEDEKIKIIHEFIETLNEKIDEIETAEKIDTYLPGDTVYIEIEIWRKK